MGSCFSAESRSPLPGSPLSPHSRKKGYSRKKSGSFGNRKGETLHRIPGRLFLNGSTGVASLYTQQGKKGTNQDAMIFWENFCSRTDTVFCGAFDGHGPYGHMVAKKVRDHLPLKLSAHWEVNISGEDVLREISLNTAGSMNSEETALLSADDGSRASVDFDETEKLPEILKTLKESFLKAFKVMDRELRLHTNIDCFCSGTTAVTLVKQGPFLVIGHVGDSRAVLATRDKDNSLTAVRLTVDFKPNLPVEAERIRSCKGRVFALHDEPTVTRVWLPNNDAAGLAMVWDVLSNKEVVDIARSSAARALVHSAVRAWRYKYSISKVDDCAVVCLFLDSNSSNLTYASSAKAKVQPTSVEHVDNESEKDHSLGVLTSLDRSGTVRTSKVVPGGNEDSSKSELGTDWSSLDGVSRADTLLNLPRFVPGK